MSCAQIGVLKQTARFEAKLVETVVENRLDLVVGRKTPVWLGSRVLGRRSLVRGALDEN